MSTSQHLGRVGQALGQLSRNAHLWLPGYVKSRIRDFRATPPKRVWLMFADHFEPLRGGADEKTAAARVREWSARWPAIAGKHRDSAGRAPRYTFFYPEEEYRPALLDPLAAMAEQGIADVEVHIHHDGEGEQNFIDRISRFTETLHTRHGLLRMHNGRRAFGFIHGNWALDNSRPDGRWCGLNNEITLLRDLGCYADFTLPSAPEDTQTGLVNTIYWATDDPCHNKSHDTGVPVTVGGSVAGDLMMIPGPLALNWRSGRLLPRLEVGELAVYNPVTPQRVRCWLDAAPQIGEDVFVKLFAHGAKDCNAKALLGADLPLVLKEFVQAATRSGLEFYYVSAWEMRRAIEAIERGTDPVESVGQDCRCLS